MAINIEINDIENGVREIIKQVKASNFYPDVIIGLARGGLVPAQYIAYGLDVKNVESISVQLRDNINRASTEINTCIAKIEKLGLLNPAEDRLINVLIVDDLIDSGETVKLIRGFFHSEKINSKVACIYQNKKPVHNESPQRADYWGLEKPDGWINFPWDNINKEKKN